MIKDAEIYRYSKSKLFAWFLSITAFLLTGYGYNKGIEGSSNIWISTVPFAVLLYANKQYQDRKKLEIEKELKINTQQNEA